MLLDTYKVLTQAAIAQQKLELAEEYIDLAYQSMDPESMPIQKINLDEIKALLLSKQGFPQQAFDLLYSTIVTKEKQYSQQSALQLHSLRSQYEIDVKERENRLLEQQNQMQQSDLYDVEIQNLQLLLLFSATLIICALLVLMAYRTKLNRSRLEKLANTDSLTGLSNRRRVFEMLEMQVEMAKRHNILLSIAIADIDFFKKINDTYGHAAGDSVLQAFGQLCRDAIRNTDIVGRIGGEEFVIVLPHTSLKDAEMTLKSLSLKVKKLTDALDIDGLSLSISCGLTAYEANLSVEELMLRCDKALYQAKHEGRDRIKVFQVD